MPMLKFLSQKNIKVHLIVIVTMVFIPVLLLILFLGHEKYKEINERSNQKALETVNTIARHQVQIYQNTHQLLNTLSYLPEVRLGKLDQIDTVLGNIQYAEKDKFLILLATDQDGTVVSTGYKKYKFDVKDRKYYLDVLKYKKFSVGEYTYGKTSGKPAFHYAYPVLNYHNEISMILIASYDLKALQKLAESISYEKEAFITITDWKGTILCSTNSENQIGLDYEYHFQENSKQEEGTYYRNDKKGEQFLDSYYILTDENGQKYMYIYYSIPLDSINNKALVNLIRNVLLLLVLAGFILLIIWLYVEENILNKLEKLKNTIKQFEKGEFSFRTGVNHEQGDIGSLAKALDAMANNIERREIEQKMTENFLKKLTDRYDFALNAAVIGVWDWNLHSGYMLWHENIFKLHGINNVNLNVTYRYWESLVYPKDLEFFRNEINQSVSKNKKLKIQYRVDRVDVGMRYLRCFGDFVLNPDGQAERFVGVIWDITERIEIENELIQAKKKAEESDKLKTIFLANMSHELRTPLNAIIGFASLLATESYTFDKFKDYVQVILKNSNDLNQIISTILDISVIESGKLTLVQETVDINDLLKELIDIHKLQAFNLGKGQIVFKTNLTNHPVLIQADTLRLKQVLNNLIGNAVKFTNEGQIEIQYEIKEKWIDFVVIDTGIGISYENQETIFERFKQIDEGFSRNYGGPGLGLTISRSLVELMGGKIWLESTLGIGSKFYFSIPYRK